MTLSYASQQKLYLAWLSTLCLKVTRQRAQLGDFIMFYNKLYLIWLYKMYFSVTHQRTELDGLFRHALQQKLCLALLV